MGPISNTWMDELTKEYLAKMANDLERRLLWGDRFNTCIICNETCSETIIDNACKGCRENMIRRAVIRSKLKFVE